MCLPGHCPHPVDEAPTGSLFLLVTEALPPASAWSAWAPAILVVPFAEDTGVSGCGFLSQDTWPSKQVSPPSPPTQA